MTKILFVFALLLGALSPMEAQTQTQTDRAEQIAERKADRQARIDAAAKARRERLQQSRTVVRRSSNRGRSYSSNRGETIVAQSMDQQAATKIAEAAAPTSILPDKGMECLERSAQILDPKDAKEYCALLVKEESGRSKKVANEAADSTKNNKPVVLSTGGYRY